MRLDRFLRDSLTGDMHHFDPYLFDVIGRGNGSLISAVLARYPNMRGILFDLGHVVGRTKDNLKSVGLAGRCNIFEGSFFESIPGGSRRLTLPPHHSRLDRPAVCPDSRLLPQSDSRHWQATDRGLRGSRRQRTVLVQRHGHHHARLPRRPRTRRSPVPVTSDGGWLRTQVYYADNIGDQCGGR